MLSVMLAAPAPMDKIGTFFYSKTRELIASNSFALVGGKTRNVDIVRDVFKFIPIHWAATEVVGGF
jgi:hypothetical protein